MGQHFPHQRQTLAKIIGTIIGTMRTGASNYPVDSPPTPSWLKTEILDFQQWGSFLFVLFFVVFCKKYEQAITSAHHRRNRKSKFYRMGSRSHSNLALTGHLGQLSPPQLRVMSFQNQQPALGAADASIDQIHLSQKSLHFFVLFIFVT